MRLCLILWVLADKALTHITPSSNDHNQSIITEQGGGGEEVGKAKEKRRKASNSGVPPHTHPPLLFFSSILISPGAMTKAGWKGAHCRIDRIICHYLCFFSSHSFPLPHIHTQTQAHTHSNSHKHTITLSLSLSLSPSICPRATWNETPNNSFPLQTFPACLQALIWLSDVIQITAHTPTDTVCARARAHMLCVLARISSLRLINVFADGIAKNFQIMRDCLGASLEVWEASGSSCSGVHCTVCDRGGWQQNVKARQWLNEPLLSIYTE